MEKTHRARVISLALVAIATVSAVSWFQAKERNDSNINNRIPVVGLSTIEDGDIVIRGESLSKVEVWAIVQKDQGGESRVFWGEATHELLEVETMESNRWTFPIPPRKEPVRGIFFRAYDTNGEKLDDVFLQYPDEKALNEALWRNTTTTTSIPSVVVGTTTLRSGRVSIVLNQKAALYNDVTLEVVSVVSDSRCPSGAQCVWAGEVKLRIYLRQDDELLPMEISTQDTSPIIFEGNSIRLSDVVPAKKINAQIIDPNAYIFTFSVGAAKQ